MTYWMLRKSDGASFVYWLKCTFTGCDWWTPMRSRATRLPSLVAARKNRRRKTWPQE